MLWLWAENGNDGFDHCTVLLIREAPDDAIHDRRVGGEEFAGASVARACQAAGGEVRISDRDGS